MLHTDVNQFNWRVNNFTNDLPSGWTTLPSHATTAHTKGADTAILVGLAEDCYGMAIKFDGGSTASTIRRQMVDVLIDPAAGVGNAGSSWSALINNLFLCSPRHVQGIEGSNFYFPIYLKAGTAIGARTQDVVVAATVSFGIEIYGKPTRPDLVNVGSKVQTIGADTATTSGVALTMGVSSTNGAYSASLGTLTNRAWWWQLGIGTNDATMTGATGAFDVAEDSTSKYICARGIHYCPMATSEQAQKSAFGLLMPIHVAAAGQDVYVRGTTNASSFDTTVTAVVYAVS